MNGENLSPRQMHKLFCGDPHRPENAPRGFSLHWGYWSSSMEARHNDVTHTVLTSLLKHLNVLFERFWQGVCLHFSLWYIFTLWMTQDSGILSHLLKKYAMARSIARGQGSAPLRRCPREKPSSIQNKFLWVRIWRSWRYLKSKIHFYLYRFMVSFPTQMSVPDAVLGAGEMEFNRKSLTAILTRLALEWGGPIKYQRKKHLSYNFTKL